MRCSPQVCVAYNLLSLGVHLKEIDRFQDSGPPDSGPIEINREEITTASTLASPVFPPARKE